MPKPMNKRHFEIDKGDLCRTYINYEIDSKGLENILILGKMGDKIMEGRVYIIVDNGEVLSLAYSNKLITKDTFDEKDKKELMQAKEVYEEIRKLFKVQERLENYNFETKDSNFFEYLGINTASDINSFFLE